MYYTATESEQNYSESRVLTISADVKARGFKLIAKEIESKHSQIIQARHGVDANLSYRSRDATV
jgi:hypothetical protein